jgi:hypothetical protein
MNRTKLKNGKERKTLRLIDHLVERAEMEKQKNVLTLKSLSWKVEKKEGTITINLDRYTTQALPPRSSSSWLTSGHALTLMVFCAQGPALLHAGAQLPSVRQLVRRRRHRPQGHPRGG